MLDAAMRSDKDLYQIIADELAAKNTDPALWTQALAAAEGDPDKTQAHYIRLRFADLKGAASAGLGIKNPGVAIRPLDNGVNRMRAELKKRLGPAGISNLYATLGVQPDASDTVIAAAIADLESRDPDHLAASQVEFRHAKQTLGDPVSREQYDRKLLNSILNDGNVQIRQSYAYESAGNDTWWSSGKATFLVGVAGVALLGYLGLGYFKAHGSHEIQKATVEVQRDSVGVAREATQSNVDLEKQRLATEAELRARSQSLAEEQQRRQWDLQQQAQERQRQEQERRLAMDQERIRQQQQQQENMKTQRERQYWACMDQQLDIRGNSSYDASARCAMYR